MIVVELDHVDVLRLTPAWSWTVFPASVRRLFCARPLAADHTDWSGQLHATRCDEFKRDETNDYGVVGTSMRATK